MNLFNNYFHYVDWVKITCYAIILVLVSVLYTQCDRNSKLTNSVSSLKSENATYLLKNKQLVTSTLTLQANNKKQAMQLIGKTILLEDLTSKFSNVKEVIVYRESLKKDTIRVKYTDSIPFEYYRKGKIQEKYFSFNYESSNNGFEIQNLQIPNEVNIVAGYKRKWLFGPKTIVLDITNTNPNIITEKVQHVEIAEKKPWYKTDIVKILLGFGIGLSVK